MRSVFVLLSVFAWLLTALPNTATAQLYCENQSSKPVWFALAYHEVGERMTWVAESWMYIKPGEKVRVSHIGYDSYLGGRSNFFFHAYQPGGRKWEGTRKFIMDSTPPDADSPDRFDRRVEDAHKREVLGQNPDYKWFTFANGVLGDASQEQEQVIVLRDDDPVLEVEDFKKSSFE